MPRTSKFLIHVAAVGVLTSALGLAAVTPAFAFGPAEITITPTTTGENPLVTVSIVCPSPSDTASLSWSGTDGGVPASYGPTTEVLDGAGEFSAGYFFESLFDRDTDATLSIECFDGVTSTGTDSATYHLQTTGAVSATPASLAVNQDLVVTGNCGTAVSIDSISVYAFLQPGNTLIAGFPHVVPYTNASNYSVSVGSGTALGVPVGGSIRVSVLCQSTAPATHVTSSRLSTTLMTVAVTPPAPPASAASGSALAATGTELIAPTAAAGLLVIVGAVLVFVRRRRSTQLASSMPRR